MIPVNKKARIVPPLMLPARTSVAPYHINKVIAPKIRPMTIAVIRARIMMRRLAVAKVASTAPAKRFASRSS